MLPGGGELLLVFLVVLLLFGGREMPRLARTLGQWSATMRRSLNDVRREFNRISIEDELKATQKELRDTQRELRDLGSGREQRPGTPPDPAKRKLGGGDTPPSPEALAAVRPAEGSSARTAPTSDLTESDTPPARDDTSDQSSTPSSTPPTAPDNDSPGPDRSSPTG